MKQIFKNIVLDSAYLGISILIFLTSFFFLNNPYMHFISILLLAATCVNFFNKAIKKTINYLDGKRQYFWVYISIRSLRIPFNAFILSTLFIVEFEILENNFKNLLDYKNIAYNLYDYSLIVVFSWLLLRFSNRLKDYIVQEIEDKTSKLLDNVEKQNEMKFKATTIDAIFKVVNITILTITLLMIFQKIGVALSGLLAFGGMSGIIVGLASKDLLANFFGGIMVYFNRPFDIGDWIRSPDREIEGTVLEIGWLTTKIKKFNRRPIYIPNAVFTTISVENPSRMTHRRIKECISIRYIDSKKIANITKNIRTMLIEHNGIDESETLIVNLNTCNNRILEIFIYCFTNTIIWENYHSIKQDVLLKSLKIIEDENAELYLNEISIIEKGQKDKEK